MTILLMDNWNWIAPGTNSGSSPNLTTLLEELETVNSGTNVTNSNSEILSSPGPSNTFRLGNATNQAIRYDLPSATAELYLSVRLRLYESDSSTRFIGFWGSGGGLIQAGIGMSPVYGGFRAYGANYIDGSFFVPDFTYGDEITWEMYVKSVSGAGNGTITIRANGVQVYHNAAATTYSFGPTDQIRIRNLCSGSGEMTEIRDLILCDVSGSIANTWIGQDKHVYGLLPDADGNYSQWSRSTGAVDYSLVDEVSRDSSDYLESSTSTDKTSLGLEATGSETGILAVQVHSNAFLSAAGSETYREFMRHSTTDANGTTHTVSSTTEKGFRHIFETCPSTSAQWTAAQLDAAEVGVEYV